MNITYSQIDSEIKRLLSGTQFSPARGLRVAGEFVQIEVVARYLGLPGICELAVRLRPLRPLAETHPLLIETARRACEEIIRDEGVRNPGAAEAARQQLAVLGPAKALIEVGALSLHWFEIEQAGLGESADVLVLRRCTDALGVAVFPSVLRERPVCLRQPSALGQFHFSAMGTVTRPLGGVSPVWLQAGEAEDVIAYRNEKLGAFARIERSGDSARLFFAVRGSGWNSARVGWRFGKERGVLSLRPGSSLDEFTGRASLCTPFAELRRLDPVFAVEPMVLGKVLLRHTVKGWWAETMERLSPRWGALQLEGAGCIVGGLIFSMVEGAAKGTSFIMGGQVGPIQVDFCLPSRNPFSCRVVISAAPVGWSLEFAVLAGVAPPSLAWQLAGEGLPGTGMRVWHPGAKLEIESASVGKPWAMEFEWLEGNDWKEHRADMPPIITGQ